MATEEITISELELADEVLADMVLPIDTATDTKAVTLKQLRAWLGSSLPTGFIIPAVGKINDERFTLLDGKTLSRTGTYSAFCNKVVEQVQAGNWFACSEEKYNADVKAYGQCGKFVVGTDYIRIPKITRFIGATITLSEIGKTYKESLPNITGEIDGNSKTEFQNSTGCFKLGNVSGGNTANYSSGAKSNFIFDASRSSSTYQDGAKVKPDHTKYPYYMVVSTEGQTAEVGIDINQVYEDLNLKANSDLSNVASVAQSFKEQSVGWGMPDYSAKIAITSPYTAPRAGIVTIGIIGNQSAADELIVLVNGKEIVFVGGRGNVGPRQVVVLSIDKNDVISWVIKNSSGMNCKFYPFKGAN